jgi:hypothetical protein
MFGVNDETSDLCSNRHIEYHQLLGKEGFKSRDSKFYFKNF